MSVKTIGIPNSEYSIVYEPGFEESFGIYKNDVNVTDAVKSKLNTDMVLYILSMKQQISDDEITVTVRPENQGTDEMISMLQTKAIEMICKIRAAGIRLKPNAVKIWVKQHPSGYYPKIEFDVDTQELQYDMRLNGSINEAHFKTFQTVGNQTKRVDVLKEYAHPVLIAIDSIINS